MSEKEKQIGEVLTQAFKTLPEAKKEYLMGFAEGVAAVAGGGTVEPMQDRA